MKLPAWWDLCRLESKLIILDEKSLLLRSVVLQCQLLVQGSDNLVTKWRQGWRIQRNRVRFDQQQTIAEIGC